MTTALTTLTSKLAARLDMGDGSGLIETLKATAFKGQVSDAQMTALMVVANQYGLNPWTKEIYAFPDKNNGIVPVVGVDGWARIINSHPQFDGMEFQQDAESCTCVIYRKDRGHPIKVTEYMGECKRGTGPWQSHPLRMLRHKAMIQCARLAFGYGGIYDQDEAERIVETVDASTGEVVRQQRKPEPPTFYPEDQFTQNLPKWREVIQSGRKTADQIIAMASSKHPLTDAQQAKVREPFGTPPQTVTDVEPKVTFAQVAEAMNAAQDHDALAAAAALIASVADEKQRAELTAIYEARGADLPF